MSTPSSLSRRSNDLTERAAFRRASDLSPEELAAARKRRPLVDATREVRLRREQSPPEGVLWSLLRAGRLHGLKFRRQHGLGAYIADFYCHGAKLVVEIDGSSHALRRTRDAARDRWMHEQGLCVLRFSASDVTTNAGAIARRISEVAMERVREVKER